MIVFDDVVVDVPAPDDVEGSRRILGPVSLRLSEHRVALIGANGSGKSTLARLVNGLVEPTGGAVQVDGLDPFRDGARMRRHVGFVFTDPSAQLVMPTALEDIELSLRRTVRSRGERRERAQQVLNDLGLGAHAHVSCSALSGGQRQLLALAGVLATGPRVIVCDEPTTLLDLRWRAHIDGVLAGLEQQVLLVTHDLEAAARADRVIVIDDGAVLADAPPAEAIEVYRAHMLVNR